MTEVAENTLVDGRYRIKHRIGSGGMADVYCAEDTHLGREVALKVLHRRFAQDQEFVERFRREAASAAGLQHPNVVGVFDRGEHDGTYYIAMEHLAGRTLKDVLAEEAPLPQEQAIDLALQILHAAGFAHRRGVIHRDFKPHNVIVDENGSAKVTDFGIARRGASEMTETGSIMGTAQYLSPEQAQGHAVTASSDLYSIGVMLYEMLTGRLPFQGDSAVSVALKHLSEPPVPPSQLRPGLSPAVEAVVMGALAKNPDQRWQNADDFAAALEAARAQVEAGNDGGQDTAAFAPVPVVAPDAGVAEAPEYGPPPPPPPPEEERRRRWPLLSLFLVLLGLAALAAYALTRPEQVDVPRVEGKSLLQARNILERSGFEKIEVERVRSLAERDTVLDQDPDAGESAAKDDTITLEVSDGPGEALVPSVRNLPQEQAVKELNQAGFKVNIEREFSASVDEGIATRTVPKEGTPVERGRRVTLFVSDGPELITVPDVVGLSRDSAESRLTSEGLDVAIREEESDKREDEVIAQDPAGGSRIERGEQVTLTVSTGREQVDVPSVTGISPADAAAILRRAGLNAASRERVVDDPSQDGIVIEQRPPAGVEVDEGSSVIIVVGRFEEPFEPPSGELPAP
jgi:eukaryotic-like serine/threonine-protein kinase